MDEEKEETVNDSIADVSDSSELQEKPYLRVCAEFFSEQTDTMLLHVSHGMRADHFIWDWSVDNSNRIKFPHLLCEYLKDVDGVTYFNVHPFKILLVKGEVFTWEGIEYQVVKILVDLFELNTEYYDYAPEKRDHKRINLYSIVNDHDMRNAREEDAYQDPYYDGGYYEGPSQEWTQDNGRDEFDDDD